jgi:hypothetical protein
MHFQDKQLLYAAFPSLSKGLTPMAAAHGLKALDLSQSWRVQCLGTANLVDAALSSLMEPLDNDPNQFLCVSMDAEWNVSRTMGVSIIQIAPHTEQNSVFIIPVSFISLPYAYLYLNTAIGPQIPRPTSYISASPPCE